MVLFSKLGPGSNLAPRRSFSKRSTRQRASDASLIFYQDRTNLCYFKLEGAASGPRGNAYKMILYRSSTNRFSIRLWDPAGTLLATVTVSGGMTNLPAAIESNGTIGPLLKMSIRGTIGSTQNFSSGIAIGDATSFRGGS
tara:strand:+ start:7734 stop:8153 length:420 start_codon:yes stop_codon:yes gene_type:complete